MPLTFKWHIARCSDTVIKVLLCCVVFQYINVLHSIMESMLYGYQKGLKMELLLLYIAIFINSITMI